MLDTAAASPSPAPVPARAALTSSASADWGTATSLKKLGACVLRAASSTGQGVDLDVATSAYWQAQWDPRDRPYHFFDGSAGKDALDPSAWRQIGGVGSAFCNPPGDRSGDRVQQFWQVVVERWQTRQCLSVFWVGFSLEQLRSLQNFETNPLTRDPAICTLLPGRRVDYLVHPVAAIALLRDKLPRAKEQDAVRMRRRIAELEARSSDDPVPGGAPTHASFVTILWSPEKAQRRRQQRALLDFLRGQKDAPMSPLQRCAVIGELEARP